MYFFKVLGYTNLIGVDISPEQVNLARQVILNVYEDEVLSWLEEHNNEFDLITGFDIIEHLYKPAVLQFLDYCFKALKPGGLLILETQNAESP